VSKPRIYVAITTFFPQVGGAEMQTHNLCKRLRERGYEASVVTFRHKKAWLPYEVIDGVPVMRVAGLLLNNREKRPRFLQRLLYLLAMLQMSLTLWRQRKHYDVLQVCQFNLLVLPLALVCRIGHKPMVIRVVSAGAEKATKTRNKVKLIAGPIDPTTPWLQVDEQTWVDGDLYGLERAGKLVVGCLRSLLRSMQAIVIVLSSRMGSYLARHDFSLPGTRIIPNGVDIMRFRPPGDIDALKVDDRAQVVVCVSKLRYEKGIDVLLQAWRLVQEQAPVARLIIVGSGPLKAQFEHMANALGIADAVEFAGLQSNVPEQLYRGRISVLPSRWEGMPNALLEATACGLACVATSVSGSEDIIQHGYNGLLVEPEDYKGMAQALLSLLQDPELVEKFGHAARLTTEKHYSLEQVTDKYIELYNRLTDQNRQAAHDTQQSEKCQLIS
jgi:glycosyltransferase involved in cell wall biosynthesis